MNGHEYAALVSSIRYKPGWRFDAHVYTVAPYDIELHASAVVQDSARPEYETSVLHLDWIKRSELEKWTLREAVEHLWKFILRAEEHESREFFRLGDVTPYPAHEITIQEPVLPPWPFPARVAVEFVPPTLDELKALMARWRP